MDEEYGVEESGELEEEGLVEGEVEAREAIAS